MYNSETIVFLSDPTLSASNNGVATLSGSNATPKGEFVLPTELQELEQVSQGSSVSIESYSVCLTLSESPNEGDTLRASVSGETEHARSFATPGLIIRKWPSKLMALINDAHDDEWCSVMERIHSHPHEIALTGQNGGQNALHAACVRYPPAHVVQALLSMCPEAALVQNISRETPLHFATYSASEEVQAMLVRAAPATVVMADRYGDCPLHFAAREGSTYELLEVMLQAAPEAMSLANHRGITPFWLLPRSYLEAETLEEIICADAEDDETANYANDWNLLVLFLRYGYFGKEAAETAPRANTLCSNPVYDWLVPAASSIPSCPREVLRFLCRLFPEQALKLDKDGFTPLLRSVRTPAMDEPCEWNENEEGYRDSSEITGRGSQNVRNVMPADGGGGENVKRTYDLFPDKLRSVIDILLEWNARSAFVADTHGRLPLAHALESGVSSGGIRSLIAAHPGAVEMRDSWTGMYMFQLAALHAKELDAVYMSLRTLPALLQMARSCGEVPILEPPLKRARTS